MIVLNSSGAEKLAEKGDMLFKPTDSDTIRIQGPYISEGEIEQVVDYINGNSSHSMTRICENI